LLFFNDCSAGFECFGGDASGNELTTAVVTAAKVFELGLLVADEAFTEAATDDAIVEKIFGVDCEEGTTVDETRVDVHVVRGWNLVTSGNDITEPLEVLTPRVDVLIASGTDAVLTDGDITVGVEGLTHVGNRNTPGDGTLLVAVEEGVGAEETSFTGIRPVTSGVGLVSVATVTTVTDGLTMEDRDISAEYVVVFVIIPIGFTAQVLVISGESTVLVDDVGTVTDKLGFTPALDTDTNAAVVVAVVVATVVVGKTGGWLGKGY
jgi:hypothetical protein